MAQPVTWMQALALRSTRETLGTYSGQCDMSQGHFCSIEVEEVHQLYSLALPKSTVIDTPWLVVQFQVDGEYLGHFYEKMRNVLIVDLARTYGYTPLVVAQNLG